MRQILKKSDKSEFFGESWRFNSLLGRKLNNRLSKVPNRYINKAPGIDISINIEASVDEVNVSAELEAEICGIVKTLDPEPEEADDPTKLGNWESCETFDQCESGLCICYVCLDISEFIPYP